MKRMLMTLVALVMAVSLCGCAQIQGMLNEFLETEPTAPERELNSILEVLEDAPDGITLSVHTDDGDVYGPYELDKLPELDTAIGREVGKPNGLGRYDNWLVLSAGDYDASLMVYVGNRDMLCLEQDGQREFFHDESSTLARPLRRCFDTLEYEAAVLRVEPVVHTASGILRAFATEAYPNLRMGLAPGSIYGFRDYDLMEYELLDSTESYLMGKIVYTALPDAEDSLLFEQGELLKEEPYEGYVLITETVHLELRDDGYWYLTEPEI